jgi:hypothetical protein
MGGGVLQTATNRVLRNGNIYSRGISCHCKIQEITYKAEDLAASLCRVISLNLRGGISCQYHTIPTFPTKKKEKIKIWQDNNKQARRGCAGGLGHISQPSKRPNRCSLYMSLNNPPIGIHFPLFKSHSFTLRNKNNSRTLTYTHFKIFDIRS